MQEVYSLLSSTKEIWRNILNSWVVPDIRPAGYPAFFYIRIPAKLLPGYSAKSVSRTTLLNSKTWVSDITWETWEPFENRVVTWGSMKTIQTLKL